MEANAKDLVCGRCIVCARGPACGRRVVGAELEGSGSTSACSCSSGGNNEGPKMCRCGMGKCKILTSKKDQSKGRKFYCCPQSTGANNHGCGMFEWVSEVGGASTSNSCSSPAEVNHNSASPNPMNPATIYARGYLDGAIRGSEQQTHLLKNIVDALSKLDVNQK